MRHQKKRHRIGRSAPHRKATLAALSNALIQHKRITTTQSKAKALRVFVEPIINRAKEDTTHNRRQVFRYLQDNDSVSELFGDIADKVGDRPGGYTRIVKLGQRHGDGAPMAVIELVDYNDVKPEGAAGGRKKTRRGRSRRSKAATAATAAVDAVTDAAETVVDAAEDAADAAAEMLEDVAETVEEKIEDVAEAVEEQVEEATEFVKEAAEELTDAAEPAADEELSPRDAASSGEEEAQAEGDAESTESDEDPKK